LDQGGKLPISSHTDVRFLRGWKDNVLEKRSIGEALEETVQLLIGLGIGLKIIVRKAGKGFYLSFNGTEGKKIADTLPQLFRKLADDLAFRKDIRPIIASRLEKIWFTGKDIKGVQQIFKEATDVVEPLRPRAAKGTDESMTIWKDLLEVISCKRPDDEYLTAGIAVPKTKAEVESLIAKLK